MPYQSLGCSRSARAIALSEMGAAPFGNCCERLLLGLLAAMVSLPSSLLLLAWL